MEEVGREEERGQERQNDQILRGTHDLDKVEHIGLPTRQYIEMAC